MEFYFYFLELTFADVAELKESEKVRACQKKVVEALQEYTLSQYPFLPSKFGDLLLRIPELQRTCSVSFYYIYNIFKTLEYCLTMIIIFKR